MCKYIFDLVFGCFCCYLVKEIIIPKNCCDATYKYLRCANKKLPYINNNNVFLDV